MTNVTPSRLGIVNGASPSNFAAENALFLKVFAGEVLTAFDETNVMKDLHTMRTISSGKSSIPVTAKANAAYPYPERLYLAHKQLITMKWSSTSMICSLLIHSLPTLMRPRTTMMFVLNTHDY